MATQKLVETCFGGIEVTFGMRGPCNYRCDYCIAQYGPNEKAPVLYDLGWLWSFYESLANKAPDRFIVSSMECANSEPTYHPQCRDILEILTEFGPVSMPINNSIPGTGWLPVRANRLSIRAALHPQAEKDLSRFIAHAQYLSMRGADISVIYVLHPTRVQQIYKYQERFADAKIKFYPQAFHGEYQGKQYPAAHSDEERKLLKADEPSTYWYHRLHLAMIIRDFKGIPCLAGWRYMQVLPPSVVRRCTHCPGHLMEALRTAAPCTADKCGTCGLWLGELNTHTPWFWNGWRKMAGWPLLDEPPLDNDAEYHRRLDVYWELMNRYGKVDKNGNSPQRVSA